MADEKVNKWSSLFILQFAVDYHKLLVLPFVVDFNDVLNVLFLLLSYDGAVIQWITSCHKNRMTTCYITLGYWRITS